jgi:hypothetical protein
VDWAVVIPALLALAAGVGRLATVEWSGKSARAKAAERSGALTMTLAEAIRQADDMTDEERVRQFRAMQRLRDVCSALWVARRGHGSAPGRCEHRP